VDGNVEMIVNERVVIGIEAHAIGGQQGGNETYALGLLYGLAKIASSNYDFIVFLREKTPVPDFLKEKSNFSFRRVSNSSFRRWLWNVPRLARQGRIHLLHTQYHLPPRLVCPGVITLHDVSFRRYPQHFPSSLLWSLRLSLPHAVRKASAIITVSDFSRTEIEHFYPESRGKVRVVYNGYSAEFKPLPNFEGTDLLRKLGVTGPFILTVSSLQPRKNLLRLMEAFLSLCQEVRDFTANLVLVGRAVWGNNNLTQVFSSHPFRHRIVFSGYLPAIDIARLYSRALFSVYPSVYEGFGLPVLESMACGCPVITSRVSSLPEVAGNAAFLINPFRTEEIAAAMLNLFRSRSLREKLRETGLKQARNFSWEKCAGETLAVYEEVLSERLSH